MTGGAGNGIMRFEQLLSDDDALPWNGCPCSQWVMRLQSGKEGRPEATVLWKHFDSEEESEKEKERIKRVIRTATGKPKC